VMKSRSKSVTKAIDIVHQLRKLDKSRSWLSEYVNNLGDRQEELLRDEMDLRRTQLLNELNSLLDNIPDRDVYNKAWSK
jgi:hypothetical protein